MSNIEEILGKNEFENALKSQKLVIVDFYASWCGPCKLQTPILVEFQEETSNKLKLVKVDVDQNPEIASKFKVDSIPTLMLFKSGEQKEKRVGLTPKATLSEMLIKYL